MGIWNASRCKEELCACLTRFFRIYIIICVMQSNEQLHNGEVITHSNKDEPSNVIQQVGVDKSFMWFCSIDSTAAVFSFEVHRIRIMISTMRAFFSHPSPSIELEKPSPFTSSRIATGSSMKTTGPRNAAKPKKWRITWNFETPTSHQRLHWCLSALHSIYPCPFPINYKACFTYHSLRNKKPSLLRHPIHLVQEFDVGHLLPLSDFSISSTSSTHHRGLKYHQQAKGCH